MTRGGLPADRTRRRAVVLLVTTVLAGGALLAGATLQGTLVYYRTPSELVSHDRSARVRLAGTVEPGSVHQANGLLTFTISDGDTRVRVTSRDIPTASFREGQAALVEGTMTGEGTFEADSVLVQHSNAYRPPESDRATAAAP